MKNKGYMTKPLPKNVVFFSNVLVSLKLCVCRPIFIKSCADHSPHYRCAILYSITLLSFVIVSNLIFGLTLFFIHKSDMYSITASTCFDILCSITVILIHLTYFLLIPLPFDQRATIATSTSQNEYDHQGVSVGEEPMCPQYL